MSVWTKIIVLLAGVVTTSSGTTEEIFIDSKVVGKPLNRFWTSTGLSPTPSGNSSMADFLLSKDEELNLAYIGSLPNEGITHVRIHWLLNLVKANCSSNRPWTFDFEDLDRLVNRLKKLNLGFELMGNPSGCFENLPEHKRQWSSLLRQILERYTPVSKQWRFETFNEPDLKMFNEFKLNWKEYLKHVQTNAKVVSQFNRTLWGPAGLFKDKVRHPLCWGLVQFCGQHKDTCPVRVLSFHMKGEGAASMVVKKSEDFIALMQSTHSSLQNIPFANDEADPLAGWIHPVSWRTDVRYAAAVVQTVIGFIQGSSAMNYTLAGISNDNGFLSFWPNMWSQRTLLARFQINNTDQRHTQMFRKPVFSAMAVMSLMGNEWLTVNYSAGEPGLSFVATKEKLNKKERLVILLTANFDSLNTTRLYTIKVNCRVALAYNEKYRGVMYVMNNYQTNPNQRWIDAKSPNFPDKLLRRKMRDSEDLRQHDLNYETNLTNNVISIKLKMHVPSVILINICPDDDELSSPGAPSELRHLPITQNEILLLWSDSHVKSKCLRTYTIEYRPREEKQFRTITKRRLFSTAYHFDGCVYQKGGKCRDGSVIGWYRVSARDIWGRRGKFSNIIEVVQN